MLKVLILAVMGGAEVEVEKKESESEVSRVTDEPKVMKYKAAFVLTSEIIQIHKSILYSSILYIIFRF